MKSKRLSDYLELMKAARERESWAEVKRLGETALKKLPHLTASPMEKYILYHRLGNAYLRLVLCSAALDVFYKAQLIASKYRLKPEFLASVSHNLGVIFLTLRNFKQAGRHLQKVEQYYQKYGENRAPLTTDIHINNQISLARYYLGKNEMEKTRELIEDKIPDKLTVVIDKRIIPTYYHVKGNYLLSRRDYAGAKKCFQEKVRLSHQEELSTGEMDGQMALATTDIMEGEINHAINSLNNILRNAQRKKIDASGCAAALLLSKCYRFMSLNSAGADPVEQKRWDDKATTLERHLKTMAGRMDQALFYEMNKNAEELYYQLQKEGRFSPAARKFSEISLKTVGSEGLPSFYQEVLIGKSALMQEVYYLIERVAPTDLPILIYGETGTGKELVARAIHQRSLRSRQIWLACNTGAIPETLLESELFGYVKGAFTGAQSDKKGYIELASNGTLFLDEIGNMSLGMQQKLLRVMEDNQLWRVGAEKAITVNTRFVLASNEDLEELVKAKRFREDLFYRINTIIITLPALKERKEDIPLLLQRFLEKYAGKHASFTIPDSTLRILTNYSWPGNIRELENEIKKICTLHPKGGSITETMLSETIRQPTTAIPTAGQDNSSLGESVDNFEKRMIEDALMKCAGNISRAARLLQCDRPSLHRKMKRLKITALNS